MNLAFFGAYALVSYPAGKLVRKIGYQKGIVTGLAVAALGCIIFASAADVHLYSVFLLALFVLASGITVLQVAANPYVSHLGPEKTASSRLTMTQAFNSLGTTIAPSFGAMLILSVAVVSSSELAAMSSEQLQAFRLEQAQAVKFPYYLLAGVLLVLAGVFSFIRLPHITSDEQPDGTTTESVWSQRHLLLGVLAIFCLCWSRSIHRQFSGEFFCRAKHCRIGRG